jgi:HEPN domain-containing protein
MSDEVIQWLRKAREDLTVARHEMALPDEETVTAAVCFHCQQFVEKVSKRSSFCTASPFRELIT